MKYKDIGDEFCKNIHLDIFKDMDTEFDSKTIPDFASELTSELESGLTTEIYWQLRRATEKSGNFSSV